MTSTLAQLLSSCHYAAGNYEQKSRLGSDLLFRQMPFAWIEERSSIQASEIPNAICLNTRAPEVAIYRPDLFSPPGPAEFFINFSWNSDRFFESKKFIWSASLWPRLNLKRNPKITAGPVVLLTSKNDQKKVFILGHFLVTSWSLFGPEKIGFLRFSQISLDFIRLHSTLLDVIRFY